jgi:hypothetical protein
MWLIVPSRLVKVNIVLAISFWRTKGHEARSKSHVCLGPSCDRATLSLLDLRTEFCQVVRAVSSCHSRSGDASSDVTCPGSTSRSAHSMRSTELRISSTEPDWGVDAVA